ncbi:hypothetical protein Pyn_33452 [Prunus yedoensis var. nudiflora]|uniref:Uncharacterized protein n=1 Tax=Prunus yedoensis var. nudiflora TaxID=2094558 RepID=A0A314Z3F1_PRUYE|nr:hypothetical protein Pyn_33452 [Prunus yedoensis var. nudiflora]
MVFADRVLLFQNEKATSVQKKSDKRLTVGRTHERKGETKQVAKAAGCQTVTGDGDKESERCFKMTISK